MPNKKKNDTKYCEGCLTSSLSRTLKPIEDYYHIYSLLTNSELEKTRQDVYPLMCWECLAMLRNVIKFQERCKTANSYLMKHIGKAKRKAMHLSDLMKTNNNTWFEMTHEEEEQIHIYQVVSLNPICTEERSQQTVMETDSETEEDRDSIQEIDCKEIKKEVDLYDDGDIECKQELIDIEEENIKCKKEIKEENASDLEQRNDETQQRTQQSSQGSQYILIKTGHHQDQLNTRHTINVIVNNKKERQKRYREKNRDRLKKREAERRRRLQYSQSIAGSTSSTNRMELNNEIITAQSSSGSEIQPSSIQRNDRGELNALQKKRERQKRYREQNRDRLKRREAERRRRLQVQM